MSDYKLLVFGDEARQKLASGSNKLAQAVVSTLGPRSRNVAINKSYPSPVVLHDGVSVAREIHLKDPFEDMGATLLSEAATKTNDLVGDGTTTATLLANTLIQECIPVIGSGLVDGVIQGSRINPMFLRERLSDHATHIVDRLTKMAVSVEKRHDYEQVAVVSSGSIEIGKIVADAIEAVGKDGVVVVEEDASFDMSLDIQKGIQFDNGFLSPYFVTNPDRMVCEYSDGYVLLTDYRIADAMQLVSIVEKVIKDNNKPLLIIADDVVGPALQALVLTKLKTQAKLVAVIAPEYADRRKEMLEDLAVLTGGNIIARDLGREIKDVEIKDLGRFRNITVTQTHTTITPKSPDMSEIEERISAVKRQIKEEKNTFRKERLEVRLSKLAGTVAIIRVGGVTAVDIAEKRERVIDAVHATKAALSEGVIPGGGVALRDIAREWAIDTNDPSTELVFKALVAPYKAILDNSGQVGRIDKEVLQATTAGQGINVITGETVDMVSAGIIDPVKVTKLAVIHAFSVAGVMMTTDTLISDDLESDRGIQKVKAV